MEIRFQKLGTYLGREIVLGKWTDRIGDGDHLQLSDATVLLIYSQPYVGSASDGEFMRWLTRLSPLAIAVTGSGARKAFDDLIEISSKVTTSGHVMTGLFDDVPIDDAVEQFVFSTWPAEERFDSWKRIAFVVVGNGDSVETISRSIQKMADRATLKS